MPTDDLLWHRVVVFSSAVTYWAGVWLQARRIRHQIGHSPNVAPRGTKEQLLWTGWILVAISWMAQPFLAGGDEAWPGLRLYPGGVRFSTSVIGLSLLAAGYAGTLWCYAAMGRTWRMGIDRSEKTALVTHGPYRWVRHPIYLFQVVMLLGVVLLLPTGVSVGMVLLHLACVGLKLADEEAHLARVHGLDYQDYVARTGRLLPRLW